jgi:hypothetical protein
MNEFQLSDVYPPIKPLHIRKLLEENNHSIEISDEELRDLKKIPEKVEKLIRQVFINKTLKNKAALKARFLHFMDYSDLFRDRYVLAQDFTQNDISIDMILENDLKKQNEGLFFVDLLDKKSFLKIRRMVEKFNGLIKAKEPISCLSEDEYSEIKNVLLICGSIDRTVANDLEQIAIEEKEIHYQYFLEFHDSNRSFNNEDIILIGDLEIKGFNFSCVDDIISLVKKIKGKGKYTIYAINPQGFKSIVWEGYIFPKQIEKFM